MTAHEDERCPGCDLLWLRGEPDEERFHRGFHRENAVLPVFRTKEHLLDEVAGLMFYHVSPQDCIDRQRAAHALGRKMRKENHYDFNPSFYPHPRWEVYRDQERDQEHAIVCVIERRAIAALWLIRGTQLGILHQDSTRDVFDDTHRPHGWVMLAVYVMPSFRRQGIALRMAHRAARLHEIETQDILHNPPFTNEGLALVHQIAGDHPVLIGYPGLH